MTLFSSKNLLLFFFLLNAFIPFVFSLTLYDWQILITNDSKNQTLTTHCYTNGDDIGTRALRPSGKQAFQCPVLVKKRTLASCDMTLGKLRQHVDLFDSDRDIGMCADKTCIWKVNEIGFYLNIFGRFVLIDQWPING
ncbi:hypothetical protein Pfo_026579 [Paulownia fortunei]|nr:hypothetical protein Pfo_026579 [Paulownia fortunei]